MRAAQNDMAIARPVVVPPLPDVAIRPLDVVEAPPPKTAYRLRGVLAALPIVVALVAPLAPSVSGGPFWVGIVLFVAGWSLRMWAQMHLGYRLNRRMALVTCGPFRFCRNPIYLGNAAIVVGVVATTEAPWSGVLLAAAWCMIVFPAVVAFEEHRLRRTYGDAYRRYCATTAAWLPSWPAAGTACRHRLASEALMAEAHIPLILLPVLVRSLLLG